MDVPKRVTRGAKRFLRYLHPKPYHLFGESLRNVWLKNSLDHGKGTVILRQPVCIFFALHGLRSNYTSAIINKYGNSRNVWRTGNTVKILNCVV